MPRLCVAGHFAVVEGATDTRSWYLDGCFAALAMTVSSGTVNCFVALRAPRNDTCHQPLQQRRGTDCFVALRAPRNDTGVIASEAKQSG